MEGGWRGPSSHPRTDSTRASGDAHLASAGCRPSCGSAATCGCRTTRPCWPRCPPGVGRRPAAVRRRPGALGRVGAGPSGVPASAPCGPSTTRLGGRLLVRHGDPVDVVPDVVARALGAGSVHVAADFGPYGRRRDAAVERRSRPRSRWSAPARRTPSRPVGCRTQDGTPYQVFTPFYRAWVAHGWRAPAADPPPDAAWLRPGQPRTALPDGAGARRCRSSRRPGEQAALRRWDDFRATAPSPTTPTARDRAGPRRDVGPVGRPALGRDPPAHAARRPRRRPRRARRSARSSPGASSTPTSCGTSHARSARVPAAGARPSSLGRRSGRRRGASRRGPRAGPASRSSTRACASCAPRAGCTTGCGWSWRPSSSRTCTWTGGAAPGHFMHWLRDGDLASNQLDWQWVAGIGHRRGAVLPGVQPGRRRG